MKNIINKLTFLTLVVSIQLSILHAITTEEILKIHKVTTVEMNNINTPQVGSLVYNTTDDTLYFYTGTVWKRLRSSGSETILNAGSGMVVTGNGSSSTPYTIGIN